MKKTILNTDVNLFLITFLFQGTNNKFIFQNGLDLVHILKTYDHTGVKSIKVFDRNKETFKVISKKDFLSLFSWETEAMEYFKNHYYFKK